MVATGDKHCPILEHDALFPERANIGVATVVDSGDGRQRIRLRVWERVLQSVLLMRAAEPREVASLVVYLASPDGDYVTGQALSVSGA